MSLPLFSLFKERSHSKDDSPRATSKALKPSSSSKVSPQESAKSISGLKPSPSNTFSSAPEWAKALAHKISAQPTSFLKSCEALSAFVNFRFKEAYLQRHLSHFASQKKLGHYPDQGSGQHWVLDFASPNVAKHINIGHLRAASLGQALVHISRAFGFKLTAINHLGDWGGQFGKLLWAYKKWGSADFKNQPFDSMVELYVRFYKEAEGDEKSRAEARHLFLQLEKQGSKDLKALWERFVRLSLTEYDKYWKAFNIQHDLNSRGVFLCKPFARFKESFS